MARALPARSLAMSGEKSSREARAGRASPRAPPRQDRPSARPQDVPSAVAPRVAPSLPMRDSSRTAGTLQACRDVPEHVFASRRAQHVRPFRADPPLLPIAAGRTGRPLPVTGGRRLDQQRPALRLRDIGFQLFERVIVAAGAAVLRHRHELRSRGAGLIGQPGLESAGQGGRAASPLERAPRQATGAPGPRRI